MYTLGFGVLNNRLDFLNGFNQHRFDFYEIRIGNANRRRIVQVLLEVIPIEGANGLHPPIGVEFRNQRRLMSKVNPRRSDRESPAGLLHGQANGDQEFKNLTGAPECNPQVLTNGFLSLKSINEEHDVNRPYSHEL